MRLINTSTYQFEEFPDERNVEYAILSHRWEEEEVLFQDWDWTPQKGLVKPRQLKGFYKIRKCCEEARHNGLKYAWVDTCCIDKKSSAELQEAINSMFRWYKSAKICYAYLSDVSTEPNATAELISSKWFTRGWTLQELIAPTQLTFFSHPWKCIGPRGKFKAQIQSSTRIPRRILNYGFRGLEEDNVLIAQAMNWAKDRQTTRVEDRAYSLLGIFGVFIPMLYGEGERSFIRLQAALLERSGDQSIFAWDGISSPCGLLAASPDNFRHAWEKSAKAFFPRCRPSSVTSEGVITEVVLSAWAPGIYHAELNFGVSIPPYLDLAKQCYIFLQRVDDAGRFARVRH
jgi:hypothetical protein